MIYLDSLCAMKGTAINIDTRYPDIDMRNVESLIATIKTQIKSTIENSPNLRNCSNFLILTLIMNVNNQNIAYQNKPIKPLSI